MSRGNANDGKSETPRQEIERLLAESGAILHGHFLLTSGRHSNVYFEKFRLLERPDVLSRVCAEMARRLPPDPDVVAGPTTGGIIVAFEVARQVGASGLYVEREDGRRVLRRGASVKPGAKVVVVDDVLTTGVSVREVVDLMRQHGAEVVGVGVLIDRSQEPIDFGCPTVAAYRVEAQSYAPDEVPDWLAAIPISKPGTRPM